MTSHVKSTTSYDSLTSELRITIWPQSDLLLPEARRVPSRLDGEREVIVPEVGGWTLGSSLEAEPVSLTGETYLHLHQVDLDDPDSIYRFVDRYGTLGGLHAALEIARSPNDWLKAAHGVLNSRREHRRREAAFRAAVADAHPETAALDESAWHNVLLQPTRAFPPFVETLAEFRYAAACLNDLTEAWLALRQRNDPAKLAWNGLADPSVVTANASNATSFFRLTLNLFLRQFSPRIDLNWVFSPGLGASELEKIFLPTDELEIHAVRKTRHAPLYAICALELFNHIVLDADYRICANERCERTFVKQEGRSEKGQHRSHGMIYCDAKCARAVAQRNRRRRQRRDTHSKKRKRG